MNTNVHATPEVKAIAYYLPQFHPIPENDQWWGKGFTEWTNVTKARPNFAGHYQPHLPADLGFYDLRLPEIRQAQADLARQYGIHGFCYYHYWFNGRRILERPLQEVLASGQPDFPFCVCWANENWSRRWDGGDGENELLLRQEYSPEDDIAFINTLIPYFHDPRYIRINGKPMLLVYKTNLLPDPRATAERWREACVRSGLPDLYLCAGHTQARPDPRSIGFDAAFEFPPHGSKFGYINQTSLSHVHPEFSGLLFDYRAAAVSFLSKPRPDYRLHKSVMTSWDNTPRRQKDGIIVLNSSPAAYETWLSETIEWTKLNNPPEERLVFINAWNEWAEGAHLEPDRRHGRGYLEATQRALFG